MRIEKRVGIVSTSAMIAAMIAVSAVINIPLQPVPFSLATLTMYIATIFFGTKLTSIGVATYILLGAVGLPIFSGFGAGIGHILGPTGGYILGYIPMVIVGGCFVEKFSGKKYMYVLGLVLGTAVLYIFGVSWLYIYAGDTITNILAKTVYPFIIIDLFKIIVAIHIGESLRNLKKHI